MSKLPMRGFSAGLVVVALALLSVPFFSSGAEAQCRNTVRAEVVALDQVLFYNRLGAWNPAGMIYALKRDVVNKSTKLPLTAGGAAEPGNVMLREDKRPRPITLRVNAGDCLEITLYNLLNPQKVDAEQPATRDVSIHVNGMQLIGGIASDGSFVGVNPSSLVAPGKSATYTFYAEFENTYHLYNMGSTTTAEGLGGTMSYGLFGAVNVEPASSEWYRSQITREEMDLATTGYTADGHPIIDYDATYPNIEPYIREGKAGLPIIRMTRGDEIVHSDVNAIITGRNRGKITGPSAASTPVNPDREQPFREFTTIFHDETFVLQAFPGFFNDPVLNHTLHGIRDGLGINYSIASVGAEVLANRLNVGPMWDCVDCKAEEFFLTSWAVSDPGMLVDTPANQGLDGCKPDGSGCPAEAMGPKATVAKYPDDPGGVHHSYINDHVKMRNVHAGPFEHHMFHLHSHQWVFSPLNDNSSYLDGQAIGPGMGYTYDIAFGGSGNRNKTPGDAIFHCHFYPHFAQGMWELWRNHDVFEQGTELEGQCDPASTTCNRTPFALGKAKPIPGARALPDGEIAAGTPIPAIVPIPGLPMAPMPGFVTVKPGDQFEPKLPGSQIAFEFGAMKNPLTSAEDNPGYPFFIDGIAGHRPPTPPLDILKDEKGELHDGGLPRHIVTGPLGANNPANGMMLEAHTRLDFNKELLKVRAVERPEEGTPAENVAMLFHEKKFHRTFLPNGRPFGDGVKSGYRTNGQPRQPGAPYAEPCVDDRGDLILQGKTPFFTGQTGRTPRKVEFGAQNPRIYKGANIQIDAIFNKVGWHHPQQRMITLWEDVEPTLSGARPPEPFVMRLNTNDCATYWHTNLIPNFYEVDDFQVRTPTDVIGQHIHLVKFDVTSSDGSGNGYNYEDGTFSPDEVRERITAINDGPDNGLIPADGGPPVHLVPKEHPFFGAGPDGRWLGARTTVQRWFADPVLNKKGEDRTLGVVFTHDHFGPSSHQQIGLYATLLVEPAGSTWVHNETGVKLGTRKDGGPTSWQAAILGGNNPIDGPNYREFFFEWSDFQQAYEKDWDGTIDAGSFKFAIHPSHKVEANGATAKNPGNIVEFPANCPGGPVRPCPEAIAADDIGTFVTNYRSEPVGLRVFDPETQTQAQGLAGDLAFAFSSDPSIKRKIGALNAVMNACVRKDTKLPPLVPPGTPPSGFTLGDPTDCPPLTKDMRPNDPPTPLCRVYDGDRIRIKVQTGATEESHNVMVHGLKWLQEYANVNSGWRNTQHMGIDEQFQFRTPVIADRGQNGDVADYLYSVNSSNDGYWNGTWGFIRSYGKKRDDLFALPDNQPAQAAPVIENLAEFRFGRGPRAASPGFSGVCPANAPLRKFRVTAVRAADVLPTILDAAKDPVVSPEGRTLIYNSRSTQISFENVPGLPPFDTEQGPLHDPTALMYVYTDDIGPDGKLKPGTPIEPLILRANAGDCIEVELRNRLPEEVPDLPGWHMISLAVDKDKSSSKVTFNLNDTRPSSHVGLHPQLLEYDITRGDGANVGINPFQTLAPGDPNATITYRWYAGTIRQVKAGFNRFRLVATPVEFGALGLMPADRIEQGLKGLIGAMVILPRGSVATVDTGTRASATVNAPGVRGGFRDFVPVMQNQVQLRYGGTNNPVPSTGGEGRASEDSEDSGQRAINYRTEPAWFRLGFPPHVPFNAQRDEPTAKLYANVQVGDQDPQTPIFNANVGDQTRFRFVIPDGTTRNGNLAIHGHLWDREPYLGNTTAQGPVRIANNPTSQRIGAQEGIGPAGHWDVVLRNGAGGAGGVDGDYLYRLMDSSHNYDGQWGIFRVE